MDWDFYLLLIVRWSTTHSRAESRPWIQTLWESKQRIPGRALCVSIEQGKSFLFLPPRWGNNLRRRCTPFSKINGNSKIILSLSHTHTLTHRLKIIYGLSGWMQAHNHYIWLLPLFCRIFHALSAGERSEPVHRLMGYICPLKWCLFGAPANSFSNL